MLRYAVIAHHTRRRQALHLAQQLGARVFMDDANHGARWNHYRALAWAAQQQSRVVVLEDDALPVPGFQSLAEQWCTRFPDDLLSFYLGTGRPPRWQPIVDQAIAEADAAGADAIALDELLHGVCYTIPTSGIPQVLAGMLNTRMADTAIGNAWMDATHRRIVYPVASLVDHADTAPVEPHADGEPRTERRRARRLAVEPPTQHQRRTARMGS